MFVAGLLLGLALSLLWLKPAVANAPTKQNEDYVSGPLVIKNDAIQNNPVSDTPRVLPTRTQILGNQSSAGYSRRHSTRAEKQISVGLLESWLNTKLSPLAPYSSQLLQSPYWSTIIGICTIEQYGCTRATGNNYWGIGGASGLRRYASIEEGIQAIDALLTKYEARGKDTIEELNGYYVQPASQNWYNVVLKTKLHLESLTSP